MEERSYALVFRGHSFGYEVQATAKVFIPGVRFLLCEDGVIPEGIPNLILTESAGSMLRVQVTLEGRTLERSGDGGGAGICAVQPFV